MQPTDRSHFRSPIRLAKDGSLQSLIERASELDALDRLLRQSLPAALAGHSRLANVRAGRLVFLVDAGPWLASLRLHSARLIETACRAGVDVRALTVKVATMQPVPPDPTPPTPLSPAARDALRATALATADPELRAQLLRMASMAE